VRANTEQACREMSKNQSALEQLFTKSLPDRITALQTTVRQLKDDNSTQGIEGLCHQIRKLSMLAEAVHLNQLNSHCKNIISFLNSLLENATTLNNESYAVLHAQIDALSHSIELNNIPNHVSESTLNHLHYHTKIILALHEQGLYDDIQQQFAFFGYETIRANDFEHLFDIIEKEKHPLVFASVIMDMVFCQDSDADRFSSVPSSLPIIFLSKDDTIETRLFAVRAGGHAFLRKPIEFSNLLEKIDDLVVPIGESSPYRVMMVEDSKTQGSIIQNILLDAGMSVELVVDPFTINEKLPNFQPELILMDLYMPKCTGIELAAVIRQQEAFLSIPIVYLSSEGDLAKQMDAMRLGGDDFLTKTVQKDHLIAAVSIRIERSRELRAEMIQDSLTGLLNHTRVLEQLDLEIARAQREKKSLTFVMLDIDHFKKINDLYGHPTGDRVLRNIARVFKQRFRKSDSVGRYGGEEFAVILPHTEKDKVMPMLNSVRESIRQIRFSADNGETFQISLSGGAVCLSESINTLDTMVQEADKALYTAKHKGRNQIIMADVPSGKGSNPKG
jgi:diguanylate cyclase (GGDEF)-like protein